MRTALRMGAAFMWVGAMTTLVGCGYEVGSGKYAENLRETPEFKAITISEGLEAEVVVGGAKEVLVTGDDNLLSKVRTEVRNDILFIDIDETSWSVSGSLVVKITVPELESVDASGGVRMEVVGIASESFACTASGGSDITLSGQTTQLTLDTSGGSQVRAPDLAASKADVTLSGAGTARVRVADELGLTLSGASTLTVIGQPTTVRMDVSGASQLLYE
ncbi:MAG: head GIN domain-containing protein [Myxococcaceae bacterium]